MRPAGPVSGPYGNYDIPLSVYPPWYHVLVSNGGLKWGGQATINNIHTLTSSGGLMWDGASTMISAHVPQWQLFQLTFNNFKSLGGSSGNVAIISAAKIHIVDVIMKTTTAWAGNPSIAGAVVGGSTNYVFTYNLITAVSNTNYQEYGGQPILNGGTFASAVLNVNVNCLGNPLSNLTAGAVDVWVLYSVVP